MTMLMELNVSLRQTTHSALGNTRRMAKTVLGLVLARVVRCRRQAPYIAAWHLSERHRRERGTRPNQSKGRRIIPGVTG
jgi:hypothetical protein